jgi:hypothetical protein
VHRIWAAGVVNSACSEILVIPTRTTVAEE